MTLDYFTLVEFRTLPDVPVGTFSDAKVTAVAEYVQSVIESEVNTSFVARTVVDTLDGDGGTTLTLSELYVLSITSVVMNGVTLTDQFTVDAGVLERRTAGTFVSQPWTKGRRNIVVTYQAGYSTAPPADIKEVAMQATRARLLDTATNAALNDRRSSVTNDAGGTTSFVLAGPNQPTGYPVVDAVITRWRRKLNTVVYP